VSAAIPTALQAECLPLQHDTPAASSDFLQNLLLRLIHFPRVAFVFIVETMQMQETMNNVEPKLLDERVFKTSRMTARCFHADKDFAVLKRQDIRRPRSMKEFSVKIRHAAIGNNQNRNFRQFHQIGRSGPSQAQAKPQGALRELLKTGGVDCDGPLQISHRNLRLGCARRTPVHPFPLA
jgi:hypothetical protein